MSYWTGKEILAAYLDKLGPIVDGIVGTNGEYQDLYEAISDPGGPLWTKVYITDGAFMSAAVDLSAAGGFIVGIGPPFTVTGNYTLTVSGADCSLEGFRISNSAGVGFHITGDRCIIERIRAYSCGSHGIHLDSTAGLHMLEKIFAYNNGGDGLRVEASNDCDISIIRSNSNTGYGLNNVAASIITCSSGRLSGNTAGSWNGTSTYQGTSVIAP